VVLPDPPKFEKSVNSFSTTIAIVLELDETQIQDLRDAEKQKDA